MGQKLGGSMNLGDDADRTVRVLEELQLAQRQQMSSVRQLGSRNVEAPLVLRPASARDRDQVAAHGSTKQLRSNGILCGLDQPVDVGSVYWFEVDPRTLDLLPCYVLCESCTMLSQGEFEARFSALQVAPLPVTALDSGN